MILLIAFAAVAAQQPPAATKDAEKQKDPLVCKLESEASSRIPNRVCHLKSEWEAMEREEQESFRRQQRNTGINQQPH